VVIGQPHPQPPRHGGVSLGVGPSAGFAGTSP
jgi:hypothetical protein